jgi:hypothetical protein
MNRPQIMALAVAVALGMPHPATAASDEDLKDLREQVRQMKLEYEKRIEALERRLQQAEGTAGRAETTARDAGAKASKAETAANQAAVQASSRPAGENAMNPGISLVLNGLYSNLSQNPAGFRINGFVPTLGDVSPPRRGLSLGESELAFAANVDQVFRGTLIVSVSPDGGADIEEGFVQTLALPSGFTLKAGRFFSAIGYQNQVHAHAWDFADVPLANKVFLGNQLNEDGVQLKWVAPTDLYVDLGLEAGRGRKFPGGPDGGRNKNGFGSSTLFAHLGGDIGVSTAWQAGLSHFSTSPQDRVFTDLDATGTAVTDSFTGRSRLWVLDGVLKWAPNGNPTHTSFKLQGEYFRRNENGDLTYDSTSAGTRTGAFSSQQSGGYLQGVYQFLPQWRVGYRYDKLNAGTSAFSGLTAADFPILGAYNPRRDTAMLDWNPSEFSRIRLQFARDYSRLGATDNQVLLQYIMSLGAHGAHKF